MSGCDARGYSKIDGGGLPSGPVPPRCRDALLRVERGDDSHDRASVSERKQGLSRCARRVAQGGAELADKVKAVAEKRASSVRRQLAEATSSSGPAAPKNTGSVAVAAVAADSVGTQA